MKVPLVEIKVALIGYVSVGKTTLLNALLRAKFSEVTMRRTTAGINHYRVLTSNATGSFSSSGSILNETMADNTRLRSGEIVHERKFDVLLDEPLCPMFHNTSLVIVDVPGINEAGANSKYKDFLADKWDDFDCVIIVMDGRQGVNTEDQVELLKFVKQNLQTKKDLPVIVACNKIDEPDDPEQLLLLCEAREAMQDIFKVPDRQNALEGLLRGSDSSIEGPMYPAFVPMSAIQAFVYRTASRMSFGRFQKFDHDLIEKLGRESFGKAWKELSLEEKYTRTYSLVSDPKKCREGIASSNFGTFLAVLFHCIGGEQAQRCLLEKQIEVAARRIKTASTSCIAEDLESMLDRCQVLGISAAGLGRQFWDAYTICEERAFHNFEDPTSVVELVHPMDELIAYHEFTQRAEWHDEESKIIEAMDSLLRRQVANIMKHESVWTLDSWRDVREDDESQVLEWCDLSPKDWTRLYGSMLLAMGEKTIAENFGHEKMDLEACYHRSIQQLDDVFLSSNDLCWHCWRGRVQVFSSRCSYCNEKDNSIDFRNNVPYSMHQSLRWKAASSDSPRSKIMKELLLLDSTREAEGRSFLGQLDIPSSFSNPSHFGHLFWRYCRFMDSIQTDFRDKK